MMQSIGVQGSESLKVKVSARMRWPPCRDGEGLHEMTNRDGEGPQEVTARDGEGPYEVTTRVGEGSHEVTIRVGEGSHREVEGRIEVGWPQKGC